jgi:GT2 family glycosyltransferase
LGFAEQCIRSLLNSDYPSFEIVVVDNGSTDGSYEVLSSLFGTIQNVRIVRNIRNLGFAEGNNMGYKNSKGEILLFLNVDTQVERTSLRELVRALASNDRVGGAQSKLVNLKDRNRLDSLGFDMDPLGFVYVHSCGSSALGARRIEEPFYADGASMAFKRSVLSEAALDGLPFDQDYFLYFEDNDLSWRVRLRGYDIVTVPACIVYHYRGGSASSTSKYLRTFSYAKNRLVTLIKNYELGNLLRLLPVVVLLELVRIISLLDREPAKSLAKLRALLWCLTNLRRIWRKRLFVQYRIRTVPDSEVMRHMVPLDFSALKQTYGALY